MLLCWICFFAFCCDAGFQFYAQAMQKAIDGAASVTQVTSVGNELTALKHKVSGELTGARYKSIATFHMFSIHC
jgi:hypothetical protein